MEVDYTLHASDQQCRCTLDETLQELVLKHGVRTIFVENQEGLVPISTYGTRFGFCPVHKKEVTFGKHTIVGYEHGWSIKSRKAKTGLYITIHQPPNKVVIKEWNVPIGTLVASQITITGVSGQPLETPGAKVSHIIQCVAVQFKEKGTTKTSNTKGSRVNLRIYLKDGVIVNKQNKPIIFANSKEVYEVLGLHDPSSLQPEASS